jgi:predicted ATPase
MRLNQIQFENHPLYGSQTVDMRGGRIFGVCGKNGVGKTTFLESLGFRIRPSVYGGVESGLRKPFLNSIIDFNEGVHSREKGVYFFTHSVNFYIDRVDFLSFFLSQSKNILPKNLQNYEALSSDNFLSGDYNIDFKNEIIPADGVLEFMPLMKKIDDNSLIYAHSRNIGKFFHCVDVNVNKFFQLLKWDDWMVSNVSELIWLSENVHILSCPDFPELLLPVVKFLQKFKTAWEKIKNNFLDSNYVHQENSFNIWGIQDAFLSELSRGQLRMLLTLIEIVKFNKSEANFLVFEEPEQNFDPLAQRFLVALYVSLIKSDAQIFLTTHSPHLLSFFALKLAENSGYRLLVMKNALDFVQIISCANEDDAFNALPQVFGIYSEDVFLKLYAKALSVFLPLKNKGAGPALGAVMVEKIPDIEKRIDPHDGFVPLPIYIRNAIHHPENTQRSYTDIDLQYSVEKLMRLLTTNS